MRLRTPILTATACLGLAVAGLSAATTSASDATEPARPISQAEWNAGKPGWEWLFPFIDTDGDGKIDKAEYDAFQLYKLKHPDWQKTLREKADARRNFPTP